MRHTMLILAALLAPVAVGWDDGYYLDDDLEERDASFSAVAGGNSTMGRAIGGAAWSLPPKKAKTLPPSGHVPTLAEYSAVSDVPGADAPRRRAQAAPKPRLQLQAPTQVAEIAASPTGNAVEDYYAEAAAMRSDSTVLSAAVAPASRLNPDDLPLPDLDDFPETQPLASIPTTPQGKAVAAQLPPQRRQAPVAYRAAINTRNDGEGRITLPAERPSRAASRPAAQDDPLLARANLALQGGAGQTAARPIAIPADRAVAQSAPAMEPVKRTSPAPAREAAPAPRPLTKAELAAIRPATPRWVVPEKGQRPAPLSNAALHLEAGGDDYARQAAAEYRQAAAFTPAQSAPIEEIDDEPYEEPQDNCVWADGVLRFLYASSRPLLRCSARNLTDVELHEGEAIATLRLGDTANWKVETLYVGRTPHLLINPRSNGQRTSMVIATDQRTYYFDLESHKGDHYGRVGFLYDEQPAIAAPGWREQALHCAAMLPGGAQLSGWVIALALALFGFFRVGIHAAKEK